MSHEELITIILSMQGQLDALSENIEKLIKQVRIANSSRFGRRTETLSSIRGAGVFFWCVGHHFQSQNNRDTHGFINLPFIAVDSKIKVT